MAAIVMLAPAVTAGQRGRAVWQQADAGSQQSGAPSAAYWVQQYHAVVHEPGPNSHESDRKPEKPRQIEEAASRQRQQCSTCVALETNLAWKAVLSSSIRNSSTAFS
jgi:hypothetical protein